MGRVLFILFKAACYLTLVFVVAGVASLVVVTELGVCPRLNEGGISCISPGYEGLAKFGLTVVLGSVFTGLPALLALAGLVFLVRDLLRWRSRRATQN
jgi:hypothetical protein